MRKHVLDKPDGLVRIVVLDPADKTLDLASQHLEWMAQRTFTGTFEYGLFDFNPGFSLVAVDPGTKHGTN